jgi:tagaturonate epimerase
VIDIRRDRLPAPDAVDEWSGATFAQALRHDPTCPQFHPDLRQLLHVGYKVAAEMGERYRNALDACEETIARNVIANIFDRHARRLFLS